MIEVVSHFERKVEGYGTKAYLVGGKSLEKVDGLGEEVDDVFVLLVVGEAVGLEGGVAGAVLAPFVLPELLVGAVVVEPVVVHEGEGLLALAASVLEDGANVGVGARGVAVLGVAAIAVIGPRKCQNDRCVCLDFKYTYHRPWMVKLSLGPSLVSQNWTCRTWPYTSVQQVLEMAVVLVQDNGELEGQTGLEAETEPAAASTAARPAAGVTFLFIAIEGMEKQKQKRLRYKRGRHHGDWVRLYLYLSLVEQPEDQQTAGGRQIVYLVERVTG